MQLRSLAQLGGTYTINAYDFDSTTGTAILNTGNATFGTTHSIAQNGWATITGVYDTYTDGTTEALTTGAFDFSTDANAHVQELTFTIAASPIPEPTSAALLSLGSCALLLRRKRS